MPVAACMFVGEDLVEVIGARAAGMQSQLKPASAIRGTEFAATKRGASHLDSPKEKP